MGLILAWKKIFVNIFNVSIDFVLIFGLEAHYIVGDFALRVDDCEVVLV